MDSKLRKYLTIIALGLAGGSIYFLPYVKYVFYDAQIAAMGITNQQSGLLLTMYTIGNIILYIPGGIIADKVAPKKALMISLLSTAALILVYAFTFDYKLSLVIWLGLSFTTAFVFWASLMKAVRIIGTEEEQGFMYGMYYASNGICGAITQSAALYMYNTTPDIVDGFFRANITGAVAVIIAVILIGLLMTNKKDQEENDSEKFQFKNVGTVLKTPVVWIASITILCGYGIFSSVSYFTPYLTEVVGVSATQSGIFTIIRSYIFLLLAPVGGLIADKLFKSTSKWLMLAFTILAILLVGVTILPTNINSTFINVYTLIPGAITTMMYGVIFSIISEAGISRTVTGTAIGIASIIGYLPDSIYTTLFGTWMDKYPGAPGYNRIFLFLACSAALGALLSFLIYKKSRKNNIEKNTVTQ